MTRMSYLCLPSLLTLLSTITSPHLEEVRLALRDSAITDPSPASTLAQYLLFANTPALRKIVFSVNNSVDLGTFTSWISILRDKFEISVVHSLDE